MTRLPSEDPAKLRERYPEVFNRPASSRLALPLMMALALAIFVYGLVDLDFSPARLMAGLSQLAPVERTPSTGFMSMFSTISENSLPSAPAEWMAMARTPAIGPRPNAMTKISANTIDGTVRQNSSPRRTTKRSHGIGAVFCAARKFSAKASTAPVSVPT